jgi:hypothetical protein
VRDLTPAEDAVEDAVLEAYGAPLNFADLLMHLVHSEPDPELLNFYLSSALATAIIRLASNERVAAA